MQLSSGVQRRLDEVNATFRSLNSDACIEIDDKVNTGENGEEQGTVIVVLSGGRRYAAYATGSSLGLSTYLQGLRHALQLIAGGYQFKAISTQAKISPRASILKERREKVARTKMDAKTAHRFAGHRTRYIGRRAGTSRGR